MALFFSRTLAGMVFSFFILCGASPAFAQEGFRVPDCKMLESWSSVLVLPSNFNEVHDAAFIERKQASVKKLLSDEAMIATFGIRNSYWEHSLFLAVNDAAYACNEALIKDGKREAARKLTVAKTLVGRPLRQN